jgi:hypothetical protein
VARQRGRYDPRGIERWLGFICSVWVLCSGAHAAPSSLDTTLRVHLAAAPLLAFVISLIHRSLALTFNAVLRAVVLTALIIALDAAVVAPVFERSYAMFRSLVGTWLPFAAIFLGSLAAGILVTA